jgi:sirohydrochlorin ferrochelatase
MPQGGYGTDALRSLRRKRASQKVPPVLVRELLAANGYHTAGKVPEELGAEGLRQAGTNPS